MSDPFDRLIEPLISREGGYVNDPADAGGETNFGVTVAVARANGYDGPMRQMTRDQARGIYRSAYWRKPGLDRVALASEKIAEELFDTGVNMGQAVAGRFLQRALNVLAEVNLTVDGQIGPATLEALRTFLQKRGKDGETVLFRMLNAQQGARYLEITEGRAANRKYIYGWFLGRVA